MRETVSHKLLLVLEAGAASTITLLWALSGGKSGSLRNMRQLSEGMDETPGRKAVRLAKEKYGAYRRYHALLHKLEEQGLLATEGSGHDKRWALTKKGRSRIKEQRALAIRNESLTTNGGVTVISYDIPEAKRKIRGQLRDMLKMTGFEQAHQSLWHGNKQVTKEFLRTLRELKIFDNVHIFEINKTGSLKKLAGAK